MTKEIREFIQNSFKLIQDTFPDSRLEYKFKPISDTHFIKITPGVILKKATFAELDFHINDRFEEKFGFALCFIDEDSLTNFDSPDLTLEPYSSELEWFELTEESSLILDFEPIIIPSEITNNNPFKKETTLYLAA